VAIVALVFAVAGSSVAAIDSLTKKQKKQTANIARNEIAKAAPGLSVANAARAQSAGSADAVKAGSIGPAELSSSIPAAHVTRTLAQTIPESVDTAIQSTAERYDTAGLHENATDNTRLTAPVTGIYNVTAQVEWQAGASPSEHELSLKRNDTTTLAITSAVINGGQQTVTTQVRLQAGDFVEAIVYHETVPSLNIQASSEYSPEFSMTWLAPGP
jgi:hypothetical protein